MAVKQAAVDKINSMTKAQVKSLLENIDLGMANEELRPYADARIKLLTPTANAAYPEQAALDALITERDSLNAQIKAHIQAAKDGNFAYRTELKGRLQNTGRASRGGNGPDGMRNTGKGKQQVMVITTDGQEFTKWVDAARYHGISPERMADPALRDKTNWRSYLVRAGKGGTVRFLDTEGGRDMKATYKKEGWLDGSNFEIVE